MPCTDGITEPTPTYRNSVGVAAGGDDEIVCARAKELADELGLPVVSGWATKRWVWRGPRLRDRAQRRRGTVARRPAIHPPLLEETGHQRKSPENIPDLLLVVFEHRLELHETCRGGAGPVFVDFVGGPVGYRRRSDLSRRQPIALAVGLRRGPVSVVDATAGLGRDSYLLASLGCTVIAVERSPVLGALIRDGQRRAIADGSPAVRAVVNRITLLVEDARNTLVRMADSMAPNVVYLDPMYPPRKKQALSGKELRICRRLVGDDPDAGELLAIARRVALRRVVVKRHRHAPPLAPHPARQHAGKQVRYDVYPAEGG